MEKTDGTAFDFPSYNKQCDMANFLRKGMNQQRDPAANFSISKEIAYWINKNNICPVQFKKTFESCGSVAQAIQLCLANTSVAAK